MPPTTISPPNVVYVLTIQTSARTQRPAISNSVVHWRVTSEENISDMKFRSKPSCTGRYESLFQLRGIRTCVLSLGLIYQWRWRIRDTVTIYVCHYRRGMDWWMDLLTIYTHHSELQVITALSLFSTLYAKSSSPCSVFTSRCLVTALNNGDSWAICSRRYCPANIPQQPSSQPPLQKSTLNWLTSRLAAISHQPPVLLFLEWLSTGNLTELTGSPPIVFKVTSRHGPHRKHPGFHCFSPTVTAA
jgi:hypothetical protein